METRGWNGRKVAREIGVSAPTVTRWLNGERMPNREHMGRLHKLFGISADAWLG